MKISAEEIARQLGRGKESKLGDGSWKTICPAHIDESPSMVVSELRGKLLVKCHAGCEQSRVIEALRELKLWPKAEEHGTWRPLTPVPSDAPVPTVAEITHSRYGKYSHRWMYKNIDGELIGYILRFDHSGGKDLLPLSYCENEKGQRRWRWKSFEKPRPLYKVQHLKANPTLPILIVEGEKSADKAQELFGQDLICMAWPGGSNAVKFADFSVLQGRDVTLWPDADEPGFKAMERIGEILIAAQAKRVRLVALPQGLPKGWDVADEVPEGLDLFALLHNAHEFEPKGGQLIVQFNRKYALVLVGDKAAVLSEAIDEDGKIETKYLSPNAFVQYFSNVQVPVGKNTMPAGKYWLTHEDRRSYEGIVFAPNREVKGHYNLWRGFSVEPDQTGDWSIFKEHLFSNVCQADQKLFQWVFGWFAHIMQFPETIAGTSLSLRGTQGTGKTIVGKIFGALIRQHYTLIDDPRYILGNFNSHLASTILLHSDEGFWAGDPRYVGKLRSMVTAETHRIEPKGKDSFELRNFMRLFITTNQDWVVPAGYEERRFAVLDMGRDREQDRPYFIKMLAQLRAGGYSGLLYDLLNFDLSQIDVGDIPKTMALLDQKEMSMSSVAKFWFTCLMDASPLPGQPMDWQETVLSDRLYEVFLDMCQKWGVRHRPHPHEFHKELLRLVPPGTLQKGRLIVGGKRQWVFQLPDLEQARGFFDQLNGISYNWTEEVEFQQNVSGKHQRSEEIPF